MNPLICGIQKYGWGIRGSRSRAAQFKAAHDADFAIVETDTYAELWMGTHVNCPSKIRTAQPAETTTTQALSDYLKSDARSLIGERVCAHFEAAGESLHSSGSLPFLFKVLSINQALSIQAHPNKQLAAQLHARDPKNYPDANHKPEMLVAISDEFEAMCGFRLAAEIAEHMASVEELSALCGPDNCAAFRQCVAQGAEREATESALRTCFTALMSQSDAFVAEQFAKRRTALEEKKSAAAGGGELSFLDALYLRLAGEYPNDVGCFSIYLLNCLRMRRGEAISLAANVPHAYLLGEGVECMACDNVVRAGLTPKFKDVQILCDMLDYSMRSDADNVLRAHATVLDYLVEFRPSVDEFSVQQIKIERSHLLASGDNNSGSFLIPKSESGSILIVVEMSSPSAHFSLASTSDEHANKLSAQAGSVYFIDAQRDVHFNVDKKTARSDATPTTILLSYRAYCDIKS